MSNQKYLEHIKTYVIPIVDGKGELLAQELPKYKEFLDRIVLFSNDITEAQLNTFWVRLTHATAELFGTNTSARFFSANDTIMPNQKGFKLPFDVVAKGSYFDISLSENTNAIDGTIYLTMFFRDKPLENSTLQGGNEAS